MGTAATVSKIAVEVYQDETYKKKTGQMVMTLVNPATFTQTWDFEIGATEKAKGGNTKESLKKVADAAFTLTFLIDATGVGKALDGEEPGAAPDVKDRVWKFLETATILNSDNTRKPAPPYCLLVWEDVCVKCLVSKVKLETKLLNRKGQWLRASLTVTFRHVLGSKK